MISYDLGWVEGRVSGAISTSNPTLVLGYCGHAQYLRYASLAAAQARSTLTFLKRHFLQRGGTCTSREPWCSSALETSLRSGSPTYNF